ncbi:MAG: hypothetical protein ACR2QK_20740 [Acidimicrobiales bacterium]
MALFAVTLTDQTTDFVDGADAYQQEGPMTTFFSFQEDRRVIDSWSTRLASYRTADITAIRRSAPNLAPPGHAEAESELSVA